MPPSLVLGIREVLTLDQLGEFVAKHHSRDLFRLETLSCYNAASDSDDLRRYLRGEPAPTAEAKRTNFSTWWEAHPRYHRDNPVA